MTGDEAFYLQVLSDYLADRETVISEEPDWEKISALACRHNAVGIFYDRFKDYFKKNPGVFEKMHRYSSYEMYAYLNDQLACERFRVMMSARKIPYIPVKGSVIAQLYSVPYHRTMSDIDIVMSTEDREKADGLMLQEGYKLTEHAADEEWAYQKGSVVFEIHDHLVHMAQVNTERMTEFGNKCWKYAEETGNGTEYILKWGYHFIYLLIHLREHMMGNGAGFRQFYDLAVVVERKGGEINWNEVTEQLEDIGLLKFAQVSMSLCRRWFGCANPFEEPENIDAFFEPATEEIFRNGTFGGSSDAGFGHDVMNFFNETKAMEKLKPAAYILYMVFPSYKTMKRHPRYQYLDGRPYLLPAAWIHRALHVLTKKRKKGMREIRSAIHMDEDRVRERKNRDDQWGMHG